MVENLRVITIASQKGGVGKTTTAVNLASSLCLAGHRVLLLDLDPQANASSGVGFHRPASGEAVPERLNYFSRFLGGEPLAEAIQESRFTNLAVLPSSPDVSRLDVVQKLQEIPAQRLRGGIRAAGAEFDYLLIDCPPSLGGLPTIALTSSDSVLIPIQCEYYAMEGLSQILPVIQKLQKKNNQDLQIEGLLLTMFAEDQDLATEVVEEVTSYFRELTFQTIIPRDVTLAEAASHGCPAYHYDSTSRGAWGYVELAREVMDNG